MDRFSSTGSFSWSYLLGGNAGLEALKLEGVSFQDLKFPNGDSYCGGWRDNAPEGEGRYVWSNGSVYEGSWSHGRRHGWGSYVWPDGSTRYLGEWRRSELNGFGTLMEDDGSRYEGCFTEGKKHGIGTQCFPNGDRFEGIFVNGVAQGPGRYVLAKGEEYYGDWHNGLMHGNGTFKWPRGRFDGEWRLGIQEGIGVFTWPDGSTYEGFWKGGLRHGVGVLRPAVAARHSAESVVTKGDLNDHEGERDIREDISKTIIRVHPDAGKIPEMLEPRSDAESSTLRFHQHCNMKEKGLRLPPLVYVCEYRQGMLVMQEALTQSELEMILGPAAIDPNQNAIGRFRHLGRKSRRRREDGLGETIYKGHRSFDLMLDLQLGIRYTLTTLSKIPPPGELSMEHYDEKVWLRFPREGSEITPPHVCEDFKWKDYMPSIFRHLRETFGLSNSEYILSLCGEKALRELPSPGKSGSVFFVSQDERFLVKTMRKEEIQLLLKSMPLYVNHVTNYPDTLLTQIFGVHRVRPYNGGQKVRFVVMNNVFVNQDHLQVHKRFDLKGSTFKRSIFSTATSNTALKDLDLKERFLIPEAQREKLLRQLTRDTSFLERLGVMDYSLLLGIHYANVDDRRPRDSRSDATNGRPRQWQSPIAADAASRSLGRSPLQSHPNLDDRSSQSGSRSDSFGRQSSNSDVHPLDSVDTVVMQERHLSRARVDAAYRRRTTSFGVRQLMAWRRDRKEKYRQKIAQKLASTTGNLSKHVSARDTLQSSQESDPKDGRTLDEGENKVDDRGTGEEASGSMNESSAFGTVKLGAHVGEHGLKSSSERQRKSAMITRPVAKQRSASDSDAPASSQHPVKAYKRPKSQVARAASMNSSNMSVVSSDEDRGERTWQFLLEEQYIKLVTYLAGKKVEGDGASKPVGTHDSPKLLRRHSSQRKDEEASAAALPSTADESEIPDTGWMVASTLTAETMVDPSDRDEASIPHERRKTDPKEKKMNERRIEKRSEASLPSGGGPIVSAQLPLQIHMPDVTPPQLERTNSSPLQKLPPLISLDIEHVNDGIMHDVVRKAQASVVPDLGFDADASLIDSFSLEMKETIAQIQSCIQRPFSERLIQDLVRLARHKMLVPLEGTQMRVPTDLLSHRQALLSDRHSAVAKQRVESQNGTDTSRPHQPSVTATNTTRPSSIDSDRELQQSTSMLPLLGPGCLHAYVVPAQAGEEKIGDGHGGVYLQKGNDSEELSNGEVKVPGDGIDACHGTPAVLFLGVIDWLQPYNTRKRLEHSFKGLLHDSKGISVQEPSTYARRFMRFMSKIFVDSRDLMALKQSM